MANTEEAYSQFGVASYSPYWVMVVVPYRYSRTYKPESILGVSSIINSDVVLDKVDSKSFDINTIEESGTPIDLSSHCTGWRITHSKNSHVQTANFTLVKPDVISQDGNRVGPSEYNNTLASNDGLNIKVQDWVMFWAMDNEEDFQTIRNRLKNMTPDKFLNDANSGLKFVGKIKSFKSTQTIAANGVIMKKYFIDAQAFSEFDNVVYYNQLAQGLPQSLSFKLGNLTNEFISPAKGPYKVNTTQKAVPFFANLLLDMSLRSALSDSTYSGQTSAKNFLDAYAPNGPAIIPKGVYDLLVNKPKQLDVTEPVPTAVPALSAPAPAPQTPAVVPPSNPVFYWPLKNKARVSSPFGPRTAPTLGASTNHSGIDIAVSSGTLVVASSDGEVTFAGTKNGFGKTVEIKHLSGYKTNYAHLSLYSVSNGAQVTAGQVIAKSGNTGISTGSHLHFGIALNGQWINPANFPNISGQVTYTEPTEETGSAGDTQQVQTSAPTPPSPPQSSTVRGRVFDAYTYCDILYQYIGIATTDNPTYTLIPDSEGQTPLKYTNTYKVGEPLDLPLLVQTIHFDSRTIWTILQTYVNAPVNEMYTALKVNHENRIFPTLVCRQLPFTSDSFNVSDDTSSSIPVTKYKDLKTWKINSDHILSYDVGYSDALDVNYVKVNFMTAIGDSTAAKVNQLVNVPPVLDSADIMRNGIRMYNTTCTAIVSLDQANSKGAFFTKLIADSMLRLKYEVNGNVSCKGIQKAISIGDNVLINGILFHIEAISHDGSIDMMGKKRFNTTLSLSHGANKYGTL